MSAAEKLTPEWAESPRYPWVRSVARGRDCTRLECLRCGKTHTYWNMGGKAGSATAAENEFAGAHRECGAP